MLMIIAIDKDNLKKKITEKYSNSYEILEINTSEALMCLTNEYLNTVVIISNSLSGKVSFSSVIKYIKEINNKIQIIVLVDDLKEEIKEMLFAKEIFNIIEGENPSVEAIDECINNPKVVIYKNEKDINNTNIIAITGSKNVGKTVFSILFAKRIANAKKDKKVLLVDMDYLSPTINIYLNGQKNYSMQDYIKDIADSRIKSKENYETEDIRYKNLKYILNSTFSNIPQDEIIEKIVKSLKINYDYVIIDTSYFYMNKLYKTDWKIIHIVDDSIKGIRDYMHDTMYIAKELLEKGHIVLNMKKKGLKRGSLKIYGYIHTNYLLLLFKNINIFGFRLNINKILKEIGVIRFEKLKRKIINRIIQGDGKYEK